MEIRVLADAAAVAVEAAKVIAQEGRGAVAARGRFIMAVSGGHTPWQMLRALPEKMFRGPECMWPRWTSVWLRRDTRTGTSPTCATVFWSMSHFRPSRSAPCRSNRPTSKPPRAVRPASRNRRLPARARPRPPGPRPGWPHRLAGARRPGARCHRCRRCADTALPGKAADDADLSVLNRARRILWVVTGAEKAGMLLRLRDGDPTIPAGRVRRDQPSADRPPTSAALIGYDCSLSQAGAPQPRLRAVGCV